jgi:hypothetical protein
MLKNGWKSAVWIELAQDGYKLWAPVNAVMGRISWLAEELLDSGDELILLDLAVLTRHELCVCGESWVCTVALTEWRWIHVTWSAHIDVTRSDTACRCNVTKWRGSHWLSTYLEGRMSLCESDWRHIRSGMRPFHALRWAVFGVYCSFPKYSYLQVVSVNLLCAFSSSPHGHLIPVLALSPVPDVGLLCAFSSSPHGHLIPVLALGPVPNVGLLPMLSVYFVPSCVMCRGRYKVLLCDVCIVFCIVTFVYVCVVMSCATSCCLCDALMDQWNVGVYICKYVCIYVCVYVYICVYVCILFIN